MQGGYSDIAKQAAVAGLANPFAGSNVMQAEDTSHQAGDKALDYAFPGSDREIAEQLIPHSISGLAGIYGLGKIAPEAGEALSDLSKPLQSEAGMARLGKGTPEPSPVGPFYSRINQAFQEKLPEKYDPGQAKNILSTLPKEEADWRGITDYIEAKHGPVSKAETMDFLKANPVELSEKILGDTSKKAELDAYTKQLQEKYGQLQVGGKPTPEEWDKLIELHNQSKTPPKFEKYSTPGGDNYREVLMTLPPKSAYHDKDFFNSHFEEPNVLAHIRMKDFVDPATNKKTLMIDEIQSDWHQKGREGGYAKPDSLTPAERIRYDKLASLNGRGALETGEENSEFARLGEKVGTYGVPDAPFKKNWHELAFKRALTEAIKGGYDEMAWTTGEQQAARYDLSKHYSEVKATPMGDGDFRIQAKPASSAAHHGLDEQVKTSDLADTVGKDLAEKIVKDNGGSYSGLDLKVGGEGMKGFYDDMLPSFANKYLKKYGVKTEESNLPSKQEFSSPVVDSIPEDVSKRLLRKATQEAKAKGLDPEAESSDYDDYIMNRHYALADDWVSKNSKDTSIKVHKIPITPEMKADILKKGQPMYAKGGIVGESTMPFLEHTARTVKVKHDDGKELDACMAQGGIIDPSANAFEFEKSDQYPNSRMTDPSLQDYLTVEGVGSLAKMGARGLGALPEMAGRLGEAGAIFPKSVTKLADEAEYANFAKEMAKRNARNPVDAAGKFKELTPMMMKKETFSGLSDKFAPRMARGGVVQHPSEMRMAHGGFTPDWKEELSGYMNEHFAKDSGTIPHMYPGGMVDDHNQTMEVPPTQSVEPPAPEPVFNPTAGLPQPPPQAPPPAPDALQAQLGGYKADMSKYGPEAQMAVEQAILKQRQGLGSNLARAGGGLADAIMQGVARAGPSNFQENIAKQQDTTQQGYREAMKNAQTGKTAQIEQEMKLSSLDPKSALSQTAQKANASTLKAAGVPDEAIQFMPASLIAEIGNKNVTLLDDRIKLEVEAAYRMAGLNLQAEQIHATIANQGAERRARAATGLQTGGFFNTVAGMIPGTATNAAKQAQMAELNSGNPSAPAGATGPLGATTVKDGKTYEWSPETKKYHLKQ